MFVILAIIMSISIGGFLGMMVTANVKGWRKVVGWIVTAILTGCIIAGAFCAEHAIDENTWNDGLCPECNTKWTFANADHLRNSGTLYYWHCNDCGQVIEIHSQFN